jgi:hypothetical protein
MRRRWGLIVASGLTLALTGLVWAMWRSLLSGPSLAEELAAARREGLPVDARDLVEPLPPEAENGAIAYLRATEIHWRIRETTAWRRKFDAVFAGTGPRAKMRSLASLSPRERKQLKTLLAVQEPAFAAMREAVGRPRFVLNRPWHVPYRSLDTDDIRMFGFIVEHLILRGRVRKIEGDTMGAYDDLALAARASALFQYGITPAEFHTRSRLEERILTQGIQWKMLPARLRALVGLLGPPPHPRRVYRSQLVTTRRKFAHENAMASTSMRLRSVYQAREARSIAYWRTLTKRFPTDPLAFDAMRAAAKRTNEEFGDRGDWDITWIPLDIDDFEIDAFAEHEALRRMTLAIADIYEFHQREHRWPDALPKPIDDPFGIKLCYRRKADGFIIYSVGADRRDDGGDAGGPMRPARDFVVAVPKAQ